ncbi:insulinase family protein [Spirochaeta cellobiosiphila]|uniref:insulinase family protein n=1 Tax=Spirochaeta cellobiosiphila TaxID=504483 RepID=UPI000413DD81|nr:insulinase family protein [Spirochaeta cellobiosiphila]
MHKVGGSIAGFTVYKVEELPEFRSTGIYLKHNKTNMEVLALQNDDPENLFAFAFKTFPEDSTGVAHILEHSVLSGSKKFPVKDPFLNLLKGSINTFLNAFTFPDKTVYPGASTNKKDYFNLLNVYSDAVFNPLLKEEIFQQEGHRLVIDDQGNLSISGVVYNEMKGNYSNQDSIASEWSLRAVFDNGPYSYDSGGDPKYIPDLTYDQFVEFHKTLYHPSNCQLFLYGDIPLEEQLAFLEENYLKEYTQSLPPRELPRSSTWSNPKQVAIPFPGSENADSQRESSVLLSWKTADVMDPVELLSLDILSELLIGHSGSPLLKALVDSGIGEDLSPVSGYETEVRESVFTVGLRGMSNEDQDKFNELVFATLNEIKQDGFSAEAVDGTIRVFEFHQREIKGGPAGLRLMRRALRGWLHGQDPFDSTRFTKWMDLVKKAYQEDSDYFVKIMDKWLISNPHRTLVTLYPDKELQTREDKELQAKLSKHKEVLGDEGIQALYTQRKKFEEFQNKPDAQKDLDKIPFLSLDDLPKTVRTVDFDVLSESPHLITAQNDFTNGIEYVDFVFSLEGLDKKYLPWLQLFRKALTGTGTSQLSYGDLEETIRLKLGGLSIYPSISSSIDENTYGSFYLRVKYLSEYRSEAFDLVKEIIVNADLDNKKRLKDLLFELRNDSKSHVIPSGNSYASNRAASHLSEASHQEELINGISQIFFLDELYSDYQKDEDKLLSMMSNVFKSIRGHIFNQNNVVVNIMVQEANTYNDVAKEANKLITTLTEVPHVDTVNIPPFEQSKKSHEAWSVPATVGYVATAFNGPRLGQSNFAASVVISHLLRTGYLWENIRMRGGAYGASANASALEGIFAFATYRDPRITGSLETFKNGLESIANGEFSEKDLELAIIGVVGREEHPLSPNDKLSIGYRRRLLKIKNSLRQEKRDQILSLNRHSLIETAKHLLLAMEKSYSCVISGSEIIAKDGLNDQKTWTIASLPI